MKRLLIITLIFCGFLNVNAQEMVFLNFNTLTKKYAKSEEAIKNEKKGVKPATWYSRGKLLQDIYKIDLEYLAEGTGLTELKLYYKDPLQTLEGEEEGTKILKYERINYIIKNDKLSRWERTKMVIDNPLDKAYDAYAKAIELDVNGKMTSKIKNQLELLKEHYKQNGVNYYYSGESEKAVHNFEMVLKINDLDVYEGEIDTVMVQYSGIIAREMKDYKKAAKYYTQLTEMNYGGPNIYLNVKNDYLELGDSAAAIDIMEKAFLKYPDTINVVANLVDLYIKTNKIEQGLESVEVAINNDPEKGEFYYWKGRLELNNEEDEERVDKTLKSYEKAIELNPDLYYVYYEIGFIYFLQGQDMFTQAGLEKDVDRRAQMNEIANEKYEEAIPMMNKSIELNSSNEDVQRESYDVLKRIYYKIYGSDDQRYIDIMEKIKSL